MKQSRLTPHVRKELDERFKKYWSRAARDTRPKHGWIREIREALGMSGRQLALLAKVNPTTIARFERSERRDTIQLHTLRKLGKAMNCNLAYALVPDRPLERVLRDRAFGLLLMEIIVPAKALNLNLSSQLVTAIADSLIRKRKMLENPHALWNKPSGKFTAIFDGALEDLVKRPNPTSAPAKTEMPATPPKAEAFSPEVEAAFARAMQDPRKFLDELAAAKMRGEWGTEKPAAPPAPPPPQRKTGECPPHLRHIEELWRAGKVEE